MAHEFHSFYYDQTQREPVTEDFLLPAGTEMTPGLLRRLVTEYEEDHLPRYRYLGEVYETHYAIFAGRRRKRQDYQPDNRLAADFVYTITQTFEGYFIGIPITCKWSGDEARAQEVGAFISDYSARNHQEDVDAKLSKMSSKYGHAYEMFYQDEEGRPRSVALSPQTAFMVFDDSVLKRPMYFVRWFYDDSGRMRGSWSDATHVQDFSDADGTIEWGDSSEHYFGGVPAVDFCQNTEKRGLYEGILSLVEAYNSALSDKANDVEYFSDAYLVVKGTELPDDWKADLRKYKVINLFGEDADGIDAFFLAKPNADSEQENLINRLEMLIFKTAMVPDITSEDFASASGMALKMRMMPMSNLARNKEMKFRRGVQERLRLLASYPSLPFSGDDWQHVEVTMKRNMPDDLLSEAQTAGALSGIVSEETQLSVLSCVPDPRAEMERKRAEQDSKAEAATEGMPTARTVGSGDMYKITSVLRQYQRKTMTRSNAMAMLRLIGLDDETAASYLDSRDEEATDADSGVRQAQQA